MNDTFSKAFHWIKNAQKILLVTNQKPSIDTTSSLIALQTILLKQQKKVTAVIPGKIPEGTAFLPGINHVQKTIGKTNDIVLSISTENKSLANLSHSINENSIDIIISGENTSFSPEDISFKKSTEAFDLIICLGCKKLLDTGSVFSENAKLFSQTPTISISKDIEAEHFGTVNIIEPRQSTICEILFNVVEKNEDLKNHLDKTLSTILITGILSETEGFLSNTTSPNSLRTAASLQNYKADQSLVVEHLFKEKTYNNIKTLGLILNNFELSDSHKFCWSILDRKDFHQIDTDAKDIDHWSDQLLRHTNDSDFLALFVEFKDKTLIQLRTKNTPVDFENLRNFSDDLIFEPHKYGADISFSGKSIDDVKNGFLEALSKIQENRLSLEANTPLSTVNIEELPEKTPSIDIPQFSGKKQNAPLPVNIPFEAPEKE